MNKSNEKQIKGIIKEFSLLPEHCNAALIATLNETANFIKERASKEIAHDQRLKLAIIRQRIKLSHANKRQLKTVLNCNFQPIPAVALGGVHQTKQGAVAGGRLFKGTFVAHMGRYRQKLGIYRRIGFGRFPVESERIYIADQVSDILGELLDNEALDFFYKRYDHYLHKAGGLLSTGTWKKATKYGRRGIDDI